MSLRITFTGGPLDGTVLTETDYQRPSDVTKSFPLYVLRSTRQGRVGASFDIFHPRELRLSVPLNRPIELHQYRIDHRHIANDATISVSAIYVGPTGRAIPPTSLALRNWAGLQVSA